MADEQTQAGENGGGVATQADSLTVTDNRTGETLRGARSPTAR